MTPCPLEQSAGAISRFSLQASARNQWFGTVLPPAMRQVQQRNRCAAGRRQTRLKSRADGTKRRASHGTEEEKNC